MYLFILKMIFWSLCFLRVQFFLEDKVIWVFFFRIELLISLGRFNLTIIFLKRRLILWMMFLISFVNLFWRFLFI